MKQLFLLLFVLCNSIGKAQTETYPETYAWQPLSTLIAQKKTFNNTLSILTNKQISVAKRTIEVINRTKKIKAVAIKNNASGSLLKTNKFVYLSEKPNGIKEGSYSINTVRLSINIDNKKIKPDDLVKNSEGWAFYMFEKDLFLCDADHSALIENVSVYCDTGNGKKFVEAIKSIEKNGTIEEMEALSNVYKDGDLAHIKLLGNIPPDQNLAEHWKSKANFKREKEKEEIEAKRRKEELERQQKAAEDAKAKKERADAVNKLRDEMNKKYGKKWVDAADRGDIQVGMHEDLVALVFNFNSIELRTTYENSSIRQFDLYALRTVKTGYNKSKITMVWIGSITIQNHKVTSITRGERWSR